MSCGDRSRHPGPAARGYAGLVNNACHQGAHDVCDSLAGGMVTFHDYESNPPGERCIEPCACPHHKEAIPDGQES